MHLKSKVVYTFNKLYGNFLRDIKACDEGIKKKIKANYKVIMKTSDEHINFFWSGVGKYESTIDPSCVELLKVEVFKEIPLEDILSHVEKDNISIVWNYIYILSALSMLYSSISEDVPVSSETPVEESAEIDVEGDGDGEKDEVPELVTLAEEESQNPYEFLFDKIIRIFGMVHRGEDVAQELIEILDDDMRAVLSKLTALKGGSSSRETAESSTSEPDDIMKMFSSLENSKICNLAKEISSEIDVSGLKIDSPEDVMKLMDFSSGNNILGNIIGKVSTKIQEKMSNGEIKHEDLLGEAMNMMSMMNKTGAGAGIFNNPMVAEMMKGMKKGKVAPRTDVIRRETTKEKLRKKLEERRKEQE